jgi:hypothetical protein
VSFILNCQTLVRELEISFPPTHTTRFKHGQSFF